MYKKLIYISQVKFVLFRARRGSCQVCFCSNLLSLSARMVSLQSCCSPGGSWVNVVSQATQRSWRDRTGPVQRKNPEQRHLAQVQSCFTSPQHQGQTSSHCFFLCPSGLSERISRTDPSQPTRTEAAANRTRCSRPDSRTSLLWGERWRPGPTWSHT